MTPSPNASSDRGIALGDEVRLSGAVNPAQRCEVERFHRCSSLVHPASSGVDCSPLQGSSAYKPWGGRQAPVGAHRLCDLDATAAAGLAQGGMGNSLERAPSQRRFSRGRALDYTRVRQLLLGAFCGPCGQVGRAAVASAGGMYPIHVLAVGLAPIAGAPFKPGEVIHVAFMERALYRVGTTTALSDFEAACFGWPLEGHGSAFDHARLAIVYAFDLDAGTVRYGARGYRFGLLECGAMTQQAALVAQGLGLGSCLFGGFADAKLAVALGFRPRSMLMSCVQVFGEADPLEPTREHADQA